LFGKEEIERFNFFYTLSVLLYLFSISLMIFACHRLKSLKSLGLEDLQHMQAH
jgi:hypothetical protein